MTQNTLYWHDYETFGLDPARDRPVQFAGIRTDENLNIIGEPLNQRGDRFGGTLIPQRDRCIAKESAATNSPKRCAAKEFPKTRFVLIKKLGQPKWSQVLAWLKRRLIPADRFPIPWAHFLAKITPEYP